MGLGSGTGFGTFPAALLGKGPSPALVPTRAGSARPGCPGLSRGSAGAEKCLCHIPGIPARPAVGEAVPVYILQNVLCL